MIVFFFVQVHIQRNDLSSLKNIYNEQEKIKSDLEFQIKQHSEKLTDLESQKRLVTQLNI